MPVYRMALAELQTAAPGNGTTIEDDVTTRCGYPDREIPIEFTRSLNAADALSFTLPADDPFVTQANFAPGAREIHLYRDEVLMPGTGRLWRGDQTSLKSARFEVRGWWSVLEHREVSEDLVYNNVDELQIAWNLIAFTQARTGGDLGITRGSATPAGVNRWVAYCLDQRDEIASAIADLAAAENGFDFEIGPDKVWRTWSPLRGSDTGINLNGATNITNTFSLSIDASGVANEVTGIKGGGNCETPVVELALDATSRGIYGLLQSNIAEDRISAVHLQAMAEDVLRISKDPRFQATVTLDPAMESIARPDIVVPDLSTYDLGDTLHLSTDIGFGSVDRDFRIVGISVRAGSVNREVITLKLDSVLP